MIEQFSNQVVWPILTSVIGGLVVFYYLIYRKEKLRKKIDALSEEEAFFEKLSRGNVRLLRTTFIVVLFALALGFLAAAIVLIALALGVSPKIMSYAYGVSAWLLLLAVGISVSHVRSVASLRDLAQAKQNIQAKKQKLESKLQNT